MNTLVRCVGQFDATLGDNHAIVEGYVLMLAFTPFWHRHVDHVLERTGVKEGYLYVPLPIGPNGEILGTSVARLRFDFKSYLDGPGTAPGVLIVTCCPLTVSRV